jgi:hypothetical protein
VRDAAGAIRALYCPTCSRDVYARESRALIDACATATILHPLRLGDPDA